MTRLPPVHPSAVRGASERSLDQAREKSGAASNMVRVMAHSRAALEGYLALSDTLNQGILSPPVRTQIALAVGEANTSRYCVARHLEAGTRYGLSEAELEAARQASSADPKIDAILQFARRVVEYRGDLTDDEFESVRRAGCSDEEIAEIIANVVLNVYTNYFNSVALTEIDV